MLERDNPSLFDIIGELPWRVVDARSAVLRGYRDLQFNLAHIAGPAGGRSVEIADYMKVAYGYQMLLGENFAPEEELARIQKLRGHANERLLVVREEAGKWPVVCLGKIAAPEPIFEVGPSANHPGYFAQLKVPLESWKEVSLEEPESSHDHEAAEIGVSWHFPTLDQSDLAPSFALTHRSVMFAVGEAEIRHFMQNRIKDSKTARLWAQAARTLSINP